MKRLRHIAFFWVAAISFLLFMISFVMWPVSYWRTPSLSIDPLGADLRHDFHNLWCVGAFNGLFVTSLEHSVSAITIEEALHRERAGIDARPVEFEAQWERADPPGNTMPSIRSLVGFGYQFEHVDDPRVEKLQPFESAAGPPMKYQLTAVQIPLWFWSIAFCLIPFIWARTRWRTYRRKKYGLCRRCGYDVRATPEDLPGMWRDIPALIPSERAASCALISAALRAIFSASLCVMYRKLLADGGISH